MKTLTEKSGLELIEEATHLLRQAPARTLLSYHLGTLPFVLGLLYFWSDMSRGAFAEQRLAAAALGLAGLFLWMKSWQAVFAHELLARLCGEPAPRWRLRQLVRLGLMQAVTQPSGLFVLPAAAVLMAPLGWLYAFYQNLSALGGSEQAGVRRLIRKAWRLACLWPGQNHAVLLMLPLFELVVFLNLFIALAALAWLGHSLLDLQTPFTTSPWALFNTTVLAAVGALTHLCVNPLFKAVYVLRCFHGEAVRSGADLKAELRRLAVPARSIVAALALCLTPGGASALAAQPGGAATADLQAELASPNPETPTPPPLQDALAVASAELDRSIDRVLDGREFLWRLPRQRAPKEQTDAGLLAAFLQALGESVKTALEAVARWIEQIVRAIRRWLRPSSTPNPTPGDWTGPLRVLVVALMVGLAGALVWLLFRLWHNHRRRAALAAQAAEPVRPEPDLADENVGPEQLPEDAWARLARELLEKGERRLALRAFYLSSLAHLGTRGLIALARFKSNLDYERELARRAHALPELLAVFRQNVGIFERVWYGLHEVSAELLEQFAGNVTRIKAR